MFYLTDKTNVVVLIKSASFVCLFVMRFYGQSTQRGHVERGQFT